MSGGLSVIMETGARQGGEGHAGINCPSNYLTGYFGGMSDMNHGGRDLQAREVLAPHGLLKVLLIVFLSDADMKTRDRQKLM